MHIKTDKFAGARSSEDGNGISLTQVVKEHMIRQNAGDAIKFKISLKQFLGQE